MEGRINGNAGVASDGLAVWFALNGRIEVFDTEMVFELGGNIVKN